MQVGSQAVLGGFVPEVLKAKKMLVTLWVEDSPLIEANTRIFFEDKPPNEKVKCNNCEHFKAKNSSKCLYCGADICNV